MAQHRKESFERVLDQYSNLTGFYSEITSLWHGITKASLCLMREDSGI